MQAVNTERCYRYGLLLGVDLKDLRRTRLAHLAELRHVDNDPSGLGLLIGKKPNQVYNLLHGTASFGEKVARSIEENAGLPKLWLDIDEEAGERLPGWPFESISFDRWIGLSEKDRIYVEGRLDEAMKTVEGRRTGALKGASIGPLADKHIQEEKKSPRSR